MRPIFVQSPQPDLISSQNTVTTAFGTIEPNTIARMLEMQLSLDRLASLDTSQMSIGVNRVTQSPQDLIQCYSEGCQTEILMVHDVATDTKKITLESSVQCCYDVLEMYAQTEAPFMKNKNLQTDFLKINGFTQTDKPKTRHASIQTPSKFSVDKCLQIARNSIETVDKAVETDRPKEKSDSPPLSSEKETSEPQSLYCFSIFNPMAVRLPNIGTYEDLCHLLCVGFLINKLILSVIHSISLFC